MPSYLLQEDGFKLFLEDATGWLLLEESPVPDWSMGRMLLLNP